MAPPSLKGDTAMFRRILAALLLLATAASGAAAQEPRPQIHPLLKRLVQTPSAEVPAILRGPAAGRQTARRFQGKEALDLFLRTTATRAELEALGIKVRTLRDGRATVTVPVSALPALATRSDVQTITLPVPLRPQLDKSVRQTGANFVRSQSAGTFTGRTGAGVVVGVVDSGIDYDHPDFVDASGNTRIVALWDQQDLTGPSPAPYGYGTECTSTEISNGTCAEEDDSDAAGHGTHVTGIAAGNGAAPDGSGTTGYTHTGMAPNATIVFVKTDWSSNGIIDAMNYVFDKADDLGLPAVINLSLGTQLGAHDGTSPIEEEIDDLVTAQAGRAVVVAAGNEAADSIHAEINALPFVAVVGPYFDVPAYTALGGAGNDVLYAVGYYPSTDNLTVQLWSPSGILYTRSLNTSFLSDGCSQWLTDADGAVILCNNYRSNLGEGTGDREILLLVYDDSSIRPPADGSWRFALTGNTVAGSGQVDFWMFSSLGAGYAAEFTTNVDEEETLGIPATAREAITVGAYVTKTCWEDITGTGYAYSPEPDRGDIAEFSGRGPTRDGRAKPELAAPGMGIVSSLADEVRADLLASSYAPFIVDDHHQLMQGTSQAAPHVAGAVALFLEDDPTLTNAGIKSILSTGARDDDWTDSYRSGLFLTANRAFGAGKLDVGTWAWVDPYETNDNYRTAGEILSGETIEGYIEHADDDDVFKLEDLATGDTVNVTLTSMPQDYMLTSMRAATTVAVCPDQKLVAVTTSNNAGVADESLTYTPGGLILMARYLRVRSSAGAVSAADPYSLKAVITRPETAAVHNSIATAQVLPRHEEFKVSGSAASAVETDYYAVTVGSAQTLTARPGLGRTARIYDAAGVLLSTGTPPFTTASVTAPLLVGGATRTYYVSVSGASGSYTLTTTVN
jgi:subtilisin family serine protease